MKIVIVGGVAGGASAAARLRRLDEHAQIILLEKGPLWVWVRNTIPQASNTTTTVRMAVARFEFTPSMPIFAKIEVRAAKRADSSAKIIHILIVHSIL